MIKIGSRVEITVPWADVEFPNCHGTVVALRFGGTIAIVETVLGLRTLHVQYLGGRK
jgi:hypothetical protein